MAFEEVEIEEVAKASNHTGISAGLTKMRGAPAKLNVYIRPEVFDSLGFTRDDRFVLLVGKDADFGMIRLQKNKNGKIIPRERNFAFNASAWQMRLGRRAEFVDRAEKAQSCTFEKIDIATVEIVLPPWADETNPLKRPRLPAVPDHVAAANRERDRIDREKREAEERRRQAELEEVADEARRQTMSAIEGEQLSFRADLGFTKTETDLLRVLVRRCGKVVSADSIMTLVYGNDSEPPSEKVIDVYICKLRKKLPPSVQIKTLWGQGWRLTGNTADLNERGVAA
ncbi:winged helix-turn-helix domain-containing protein [Rhizobium sp. PAMB 3182]